MASTGSGVLRPLFAAVALMGILAASAATSGGAVASPPEADGASATATDVGTSTHSDNIYFEQAPSNVKGVNAPQVKLNFSFDNVPANYSIPEGQPWRGVTATVAQPSQNKVTVTAVAGHHESLTPAQWFNAIAPNQFATDGTPGLNWKLFYAFTGTLSINGTSYPISMGQSSYDWFRSPWWVGGGAGWTVDKYGTLYTPDNKYLLYPPSSGTTMDSVFVTTAANNPHAPPSNALTFSPAPPPFTNTPPPPQPTVNLGFTFDNVPANYSITTGQAWQGVVPALGTKGQYGYQDLRVNVVAGTANSAPPAQFLMSNTDLQFGYAGTPTELNYALSGKLLINGTGYPVYLGRETHWYGGSWTLGTPKPTGGSGSWTRTKTGHLLTPDGKYVVCLPNPDGHYFANSDGLDVTTAAFADTNCPVQG